jgi:amino acid adenylation domain-containing protein
VRELNLDSAVDTFHPSPQQEQLWVAEPDGPTGRIQAVVALRGAVENEAIREALRRATERHESLRTTFARQPGLLVPLQAVHERLEPAWGAREAIDAAARERALAGELSAPLDLMGGPLLRALLLSRSSDRHELVLTASALVMDAPSLSLLVGELAAGLGAPVELVEEPLQYADFAAWQREQVASGEEEARAALDTWTELRELPPPRLPFTGPAGGPLARIPVEISAEMAAGVQAVAQRYGIAAPILVQAAWHVVLGRYSGEAEVVVAVLAAERRHTDLEGAIGAYSRAVPVRAGVGPELTVAELLRGLERSREDALVLQDYAPADLSLSLLPAFVEIPTVHAHAGSLQLGPSGVPTVTGHPLTLAVLTGDGALAATLEHDSGRHRPEDARRLASSLSRLLTAIVQAPGAKLGELDLLDESERRRVLFDYSALERAAADGTVAAMVAAHAQAAPRHVAVADGRRSLTYEALERQANQLAQRLARGGVGPDVTVGLFTDRSVDMVVGLLGILRAGGAYVPLHPEHPAARLGQQLESAGAHAIVTQQALLGQLPEFAGEIVCLDRDAAQLATEPAGAPVVDVRAEHLAYVIFTSGSTGTPKGVMVSNGNVVNYARALLARLGASEPLTFATVTSIATDLGNTAVFGALCSGGTLLVVDQPTAGDPGALAAAFAATPVDVLKITPSHLAALLAGGETGVLPRRLLVLGGERAPWELVERVRGLSTCRILNHYGPTETTVGSCAFLVEEGPDEYGPASVPIGSPLDGTACYVLDDARRPLPVGAPGRLFIAGAGVARGYAGAPELTAERFVADPFAGGRMYDTGDIVRWLPGGALEFLGRRDEQVKIRGYRVEPAEVEAVLRSHPQVIEAAVVARPHAGGELRLIGYCAVAAVTAEAELQAHAARWLPEYMRPAAIVTLERLPQTPSGKVDRQALPDPEEAVTAGGDLMPPRTPMEEAVAAIWAEVLGLPAVGVEDDFFALGGHSLLATQVVAQIRSDFAVDLPLHSLFTFPTVATLTAEIVQMMGAADDEETARLMAELEGMSEEEAQRLLDGGGAAES